MPILPQELNQVKYAENMVSSQIHESLIQASEGQRHHLQASENKQGGTSSTVRGWKLSLRQIFWQQKEIQLNCKGA